MDLVKPEPLVLGGCAHYTLTSYEPVSVEVQVHDITDDDVEQSMRVAITQMGGDPERLFDDAWIRDHFDGIHNAAELRSVMREELEAMNEEMVDRQLATACAEELAKRLVQRVMHEQVALVRKDLEETFAASLQQQGLSTEAFLAQTGGSRAQMDAMFDEQARKTAEEEAAIDAWAQKNGITVDDNELLELLGVTPDHAKEMMDRLRVAGRLDQMRTSAVRSKALDIIMDECICNFIHDGAASDKKSSHPHLKLV